MSGRAFFDTNVLIYALAQSDPRTEVAERLLADGGVIAVQVINEFVWVARRKLHMPWPEVLSALDAVRTLCGEPAALDGKIHDLALDLSQRHALPFFDGLIVSAALQARCEVLYSEDFQHGQTFESRLVVENPFRP